MRRTRNRSLPRPVLPALLLAAVAAQASANVVHNTYAPGDLYDSVNSHTAFGPSTAGPGQSLAVPFTVNLANQQLDKLVFTASWAAGQALGFMSLHADSGSGTPGAAIETLPIFFFMHPPNTVLTTYMNSQSTPALTQGATYWAVLTAPSGTTLRWNDNITGATGFAIDNAGWTIDSTPGRQPVLRVETSAVPAPAGVLPVLAGLGLVARRRR